MLGSLAGAAAS